jgi:serine phosphatase RsbU (regulator of sigma subunit)
MAVLVRTQGSHQGKWVYTLGPRCVLGRHAECDIADIFAANASVSRFHAVLELLGGRYIVEDKGSRNGTSLNGKRLTERTSLRNGDRLEIAGVELTFYEGADSVGPAGALAAGADRISFVEPAGSLTPLSSLAVAGPSPTIAPVGYSADKLRALVQMLKCLGRSLDIDATLRELLQGLFAIFPQAQSGFVAFTFEGQEGVTPRATHFRREEANQRVGLSRSLVRHVLARREAVLWASQDAGQGSTGTLEDLQIRCLMCVPLLDGDDRPFGVVQIDTNQPTSAFTSEDLEVMGGVVTQAAVAVRFAKLHEEALRRQAVARDLDLARRVQLGLLPESYPDCEGFEFFAYYRAAYEVGGDYYDFIELPNGRLALVVADAAGKGVAAALMMAKLSGELKYHLSCESPAAALTRMSDSVCGSDMGQFVTLLAAILDRRSFTMTFVNAGHPAALRRRRDGTVEIVGESARGLALGLAAGREYREFSVAIEPGDLWLAYTDGITEATSAAGKMFGAAHLRERLAAVPPVVRESGDRIVREVLNFLGDTPQSDDMCLVSWGLMQDGVERTVDICSAPAETTKKVTLSLAKGKTAYDPTK